MSDDDAPPVRRDEFRPDPDIAAQVEQLAHELARAAIAAAIAKMSGADEP